MKPAPIPVIDIARARADEVQAALVETGSLLLRDTSMDTELCERALADAESFFALSAPTKHELAIERSPHFRGYSEMHNERDWREQIHFGRETHGASSTRDYTTLQGPNVWPPDGAWRARMLHYLAAVESTAQRLLASIAVSLGLPASSFADESGREPHLLMKLIRYHPQPNPAVPRSGVAAHVDFSWVTLTLQDDVGGLEVRTPAGAWLSVPPTRCAWLVNVGEILQFATRGALCATPHRVVNPSSRAARISIPVFLNPSLETVVRPLRVQSVERGAQVLTNGAHVHRVLDPDCEPVPFHFGEAEWRRKGLNVWCRACVTA